MTITTQGQSKNVSAIRLTGTNLNPQIVKDIAYGASVSLCPDALKTMAQTRRIIEQAIASRQAVYGVTTGLGPRVTDNLPDESMDSFSLNTIRGRAHAVGTPLDPSWVRAGVAARANSLLLGAAGTKPELAQHLVNCLNAGITPVIPGSGTIGVADLTWGGALGLAVIGEGQMHMPDGAIVSAKAAMESAGINPYQPKPREGLALVSHSSITAGIAALGWMQLKSALATAQSSAALSMEGFRANLSPLDERVLQLRPQAGQNEAAAQLRQILADSTLFKNGEARRLQDPLSIRNIAQVHGSVWATLDSCLEALTGELNGASDNPAVLLDSAEILSHGGYLPTHLSITLNSTLQAFVHLAALQVARISKLLFERFSGLSNGLTCAGAEGAGLGPIMKTAETLYAEIAHSAAPSPIYPGISADGLEDVSTHVAIPMKSMFSIALRLQQLSAIEGIVAAQAIDLRGINDSIAPELKALYRLIRSVSDPVKSDRPLGVEIDALAKLLHNKSFNAT